MKIIHSILLSALCFGQFAASGQIAEMPDDTPTGSDSLYVISYSRDVSLGDLVDSLNQARIHVERQLSCTRGLVVRVNSEDEKYKVSSFQGVKVQAYGSTHATTKGSSLNRRLETHSIFENMFLQDEATEEVEDLRDFQHYNQDMVSRKDCVCKNFKQPDILTRSEVKKTTNYIINEIQKGPDCFDGSVADCAGALLRNAFHDAAPFNGSDKKLSGSNGCVDLSNPGNTGLGPANLFLQKIQRKVFRNFKKRISMADLIAIGGSAAVKATGGPRINVKLGRRDIPCRCEETVLPPAEQPEDAEAVVSELATQLGLSGKNMVALMASHTLGRLEPANTGYSGTWVPEPDAALFTNTYFWGMFCIPWLKVQRSTFNGVQLTEWLVDPSIGNITFLNTDAILAFKDIEHCDLFGGVRHLPPGIKPSVCDVILPDGTNIGPFPDPDIPGTTRCEFRDDVGLDSSVQFTNNQTIFFRKYRKAYKKLMETTVPCDELYTPE